MGARSAGNPHAACDVEGAGNVARPGGLGLAGAPVLDPTCEGGGVRFPSATRLVAGFEHEADARRFLEAMRERLAAFALNSPLTKSCGSDSVALLAWGRISDGDGTIGGCSG